MSPEAVEQSGQGGRAHGPLFARAVGYYLVTGETVFFGATIGEVLMKGSRLNRQAIIPMREPLSADFEELLMRCLAKSPGDRPGSGELEAALGRCAAATQWVMNCRRLVAPL